MMPSRGLQIPKAGKISRSICLQCRNLSSASRPFPRNISQRGHLIAPTSTPWSRTIPVAVSSIAAVRHASWYWNPFVKKEVEAVPEVAVPPPASSPQPITAATPPPPPAQSISATSAPTETAQFSNLDTITLDNIDLKDAALDTSQIPEGIGYLSQIGIDYGIGPTSGIQWVLEHFHVWGGLPWWGSIAATAILVRLVAFPFYLKSSDVMARQNALVSVTKPITDRMSAAQKAGNTQEVMMAFQQLGAIRKRAGISYTAQFVPMILQGVIGYCGFKLTRACATLPVPGFVDGGFLWLRDLTLTDGYLLMPALMAGTIHLIVRMGGENGAGTEMPAGMKKIMMYGMPALIALVTAWQPGAVCVWFAASGLIGIAQGQLLQRAKVREFFRLAPLYRPQAGEGSANPFNAMLESRLQDAGFSTTTGAPTSAPPPGPAVSGALAGKNAAYMAPTFQYPNLNTQRSSRTTINTTLVPPKASAAATTATASSSTSASTSPSSPKKSAFSGVSDKFQEMRNLAAKTMQKSPEQLAKDKKAAYKRRAAEYEKAAQKRGGGR